MRPSAYRRSIRVFSGPVFCVSYQPAAVQSLVEEHDAPRSSLSLPGLGLRCTDHL